MFKNSLLPSCAGVGSPRWLGFLLAGLSVSTALAADTTLTSTGTSGITWGAGTISGGSLTGSPVAWAANDNLFFTGTGDTISLAGATNLGTGILTLDPTTGGFTVNSNSLTAGAIRVGTGDTANIGSVLSGTNLTVGVLSTTTALGGTAGGTLVLNTSSALTGGLTINNGVVLLNGTGISLASGTGITINGSGVRVAAAAAYPLDYDNVRTGLLQINSGGGNAIGSQMVTMNGGTLLYRDLAGGDQTLTVQNVTLATGGNTFIAGPSAATVGDTLAITNLTRTTGATAEFRSAFGTLGGSGDLGRITVANVNAVPLANNNGIIGGWASAGSGGSTTSNAFATLGAGGIAAALPDRASGATVGAATAISQDFTTAASTENWLINANALVDGGIIPVTTVNSLIEQNDLILNNSAKLVVGSGGLILRSSNFWMQTQGGVSGRLTTGLASGELFIRTSEQINSATDQRIRVAIEDNGAVPTILVKNGPGKLGLGGNTGPTTVVNNSYTGGTLINEGTILAYDATAFGAATGAVTVRNGGQIWINGSVTISNPITLSGLGAPETAGTLGALKLEANAVASGPVTLAGDSRINVDAANFATVSGAISGAGFGIEKTGTGTLTLSNGGGTFTGDVTVNAGTLRSTTNGSGNGGNSTLGKNQAGRNIVVNAGATLFWDINNVFGGSGMTAGALPTIIVNGGTFNATHFDVVGNVVLNGAAMTQTTVDSGSYEGFEFIGSVTVGGTAATTISSTNGRANHLGKGIEHVFTVADATGSSAPDLIVNNPFRDGSGDNPGVGILTKAGPGTMQLNAANIYTGLTTVSGGTLEIGGALGSISTSAGVIVNGGTLAITGTAADRIGNAAPITFGSAAGNKIALSGNVTETVGTLSLAANSTFDFGIGGTDIWTFANSSAQSWGSNELSVLNWSGNLAGGGTDQLFFGSSAAGLTAGQASQVKFYGEGGGLIGPGTMLATGEIVPVPEPAALVLSLGMLGCLMQRRRR